MSEFDLEKDLLYMVVYDSIDEISMGYITLELRRGPFPGKTGESIVKNKLVFDPMVEKYSIADSYMTIKVLDACNKITKKMCEEYRDTFVILIAKRIEDWMLIVDFSACEIVSIDAVIL